MAVVQYKFDYENINNSVKSNDISNGSFFEDERFILSLFSYVTKEAFAFDYYDNNQRLSELVSVVQGFPVLQAMLNFGLAEDQATILAKFNSFITSLSHINVTKLPTGLYNIVYLGNTYIVGLDIPTKHINLYDSLITFDPTQLHPVRRKWVRFITIGGILGPDYMDLTIDYKLNPWTYNYLKAKPLGGDIPLWEAIKEVIVFMGTN